MTDPNPFDEQIEKFRSLPMLDARALQDWEFKHIIAPRLGAAGWESRFQQRLALNKGQKMVLNDAKELLRDKGAIIALVGERGLGKTTIAAHLAIDRTEHFWNFYSIVPEEREGMRVSRGIPVYRKMAQMVKKFKSLYADFGSIETDSLIHAQAKLCEETLLIIDELHECDELKIKDRLLTDLVDIRYAKRKDTILISNQTEEDFRRTTNDSILSRLSEHGRVIVCKWKSFREARI